MKDKMKELRSVILDTAGIVLSQMDDPVFLGEQQIPGQHGEMKANIMLAYRHLEDARMRLGKVIQQIDGGVSIYDKGGENADP